MTPANILSAIQDVLQASSDLSYVNDSHIFIGKRTNITNYPVIVIEPGPIKKMRDEYPDELLTLRVVVAGGIKVFDEDKQIVGDTNIKGIADFENDIKIALSQDHTLSGEAINLDIIDSFPDDAGDWPIRGFVINIEVLYRQNRTART